MLKQIGLIIKHNRELGGLSLRALSDCTGLSSSYISQVENGKVSPSLSSLVKIADALGTTIQGLFEQVSQKEENPVVRREDRREGTSVDQGVSISFATNSVLSRIMAVTVVELQVGAQTGDNATAYKRFGSMVIYVTKGKIEATLGEEKFILKKGDSLNVISNMPHSARNIHNNVSEVIFFLVPNQR